MYFVALPPCGPWVAAAAPTEPGGAFVRKIVEFPPAPQELFFLDEIICGRIAVATGCVNGREEVREAGRGGGTTCLITLDAFVEAPPHCDGVAVTLEAANNE